jgi:hypothetical protein
MNNKYVIDINVLCVLQKELAVYKSKINFKQ